MASKINFDLLFTVVDSPVPDSLDPKYDFLHSKIFSGANPQKIDGRPEFVSLHTGREQIVIATIGLQFSWVLQAPY